MRQINSLRCPIILQDTANCPSRLLYAPATCPELHWTNLALESAFNTWIAFGITCNPDIFRLSGILNEFKHLHDQTYITYEACITPSQFEPLKYFGPFLSSNSPIYQFSENTLFHPLLGSKPPHRRSLCASDNSNVNQAKLLFYK